MRKILPTTLLLLAAPAAHAEYAVLRNGQRLHVTGYECAGLVMRLHVPGGTVEVAADQLVAVEPEEVFPVLASREPTAPFGELIRAAAREHGLEEELLASVIAAESNFNPHAVSRRRAQGLMQLLPATARQYAVTNVFDPEQNINAGARYLRALLERYNNDLVRALAAYNAGPEQVNRYRGLPPFPETRAYIRRVTRRPYENDLHLRSSP
jgi:soluble lytic murein transglycosylase-like protein